MAAMRRARSAGSGREGVSKLDSLAITANPFAVIH